MSFMILPAFKILFTLTMVYVSISFSGIAQDDEFPLPFIPTESPYDTAPSFPGGDNALQEFIDHHLNYPEPEKTKHLEGNVLVKIKVEQSGEISEINVLNGVPNAPHFVAESKHMILSMPPWNPAIKNGRPVAAEYIFSIRFALKESGIER